MQPSPLQLTQYFFTKLSVDQRDKALSQPTFAPANLNMVKMEAKLELAGVESEKDDPTHFTVRLGIALDKDHQNEIPYDLSVELLGFFEVSPNLPKEKRAALVLANGAAILYSAAREAIRTLTGRFMSGHVTMPSVNFIDDADRMEVPSPADPAAGPSLKFETPSSPESAAGPSVTPQDAKLNSGEF